MYKQRLVFVVARILLLFFLLMAGGLVNGVTVLGAVTFESLVEKLVDRETLWQAPQGRLRVFSSYDRTGSDHDGKGYLRREVDWYVVAELDAPGAVTRIWSAEPKGEIRVILDGADEAVISCEWEDLFGGDVEPFSSPFVHNSSNQPGSHWSYIPIPFTRSCKVLISEPCFYQIEMREFGAATEVTTLSLPLSSEQKKVVADSGQAFKVSTSPPFDTSEKIKEFEVSHAIPAGREILMATFAGPGIIHGARIYWEGTKDETGRDLFVRMKWDDEEAPSVSAPPFDLFGCGIDSMLSGRERSGWHYLYYPMPFEKTARIYVENDREEDPVKVDMVFYVEESVTFEEPPRKFHALWQRDTETAVELPDFASPTDPLVNANQNYVALSTRGEGHVVGMSIFRSASAESDTMIFVDENQSTTSLLGPGQGGFYDLPWEEQRMQFPFSGGVADEHNAQSMLRHFVASPILFDEGIVVSAEHGNANTKRLDVSSVVYWYQKEPHEPFAPALPIGARQFRDEAITQPVLIMTNSQTTMERPYEAESLAVLPMGGMHESQDMSPYGPDWSENQQLLFEAQQARGMQQITFPPMRYSGYYKLKAILTESPEGAQVDIGFHGQEAADSVDLYHSWHRRKMFTSEQFVYLHASEQPRVNMTVAGKHKNSDGYEMGIDTLEMVPATRAPDALEMRGPYVLSGTGAFSLMYYTNTRDGERLPLGFGLNEEQPEAPAMLQAGDDGFIFENLLQEYKLKRGFVWVTWEVDVEKAGIYRFEVGPVEHTPFLLLENQNRLRAQPEKLMVNEVVVSADDTLRYDSASGQLAPMRFRLPLNAGTNRISWLVEAGQTIPFKPVLYGLLPE